VCGKDSSSLPYLKENPEQPVYKMERFPVGFGDHLSKITTRWSVLRTIRQSLEAGSSAATGEDAARAARADFACRYSKVIRDFAYAIAKDDHVADDVSQEVLARMFRGEALPPELGPEKGKFRDWLKRVIRTSVALHFRGKRPSVPIDQFALASKDSPPTSDVVFLKTWRRAVVDAALFGLMRYEEMQGADNHFHRIVTLAIDYPDEKSAELAARLREQSGRDLSDGAFRQQQCRARRIFSDLLVAEVARGIKRPAPRLVEDALIDLGLYEYVRRFLKRRTSGLGESSLIDLGLYEYVRRFLPASWRAEQAQIADLGPHVDGAERLLSDPIQEVRDGGNARD
jgi:DNA-directed RNA polymerase specialized sigma24 family protein